MDNEFEIIVFHKDEELTFPARLLAYGFNYKIEVVVEDAPVQFERDDEGEWRAIVYPSALQIAYSPDVELLKVIAHSLDKISS